MAGMGFTREIKGASDCHFCRRIVVDGLKELVAMEKKKFFQEVVDYQIQVVQIAACLWTRYSFKTQLKRKMILTVSVYHEVICAPVALLGETQASSANRRKISVGMWRIVELR